MAVPEVLVARHHWQTAIRLATAQTLTAMLLVVVIVAVVMFGLWAWHIPEPHTSAYGAITQCPPHEAGNPWCIR